MNRDEVSIHSFAETEHYIRHLVGQMNALAPEVRDHSFRFDTLQTPLWKRIWFVIDGWPWYDLNARTRKSRPWHRTKLNSKGWVK